MDLATILWIVLCIASAAISALGTGWFISRRLREEITTQSKRAAQAETLLESERTAAIAATAATATLEQRMRDAFANLSQDALRQNTAQVLERIETALRAGHTIAQGELSNLLSPLHITLAQYQANLHSMEARQQTEYGSLTQYLQSVVADQRQLQTQTQNLVAALRQPQVRGRWGEIQLRRVIELAGMSELCDFAEQPTTMTAEGAPRRPDLQIRLPNQRCIVVDSKVPLSAYLDAHEAADDETRRSHLQRHARQVRDRVNDLASKAYQEQLDGAHDFVVLFIPGDVFYAAALEHNHELLEYAFSKNIILANPGTLIGILKAVAMGWREMGLARDAKLIRQQGEELYKRFGKLIDHLSSLGKQLSKATQAYNDTIGTLESRLLPSARKMHELQIGSVDIDIPSRVELETRSVHSSIDRITTTSNIDLKEHNTPFYSTDEG